MHVTVGLLSIANRVTGRYEGSDPTSVTSVPCRVVMYGRVLPSICDASMALTECGIA